MIESFLKIPQNFQGKCTIYPPTVNQVLREETKQLINLLTISQEEIEDFFVDKVDNEGKPINPPDPFTYLLMNAQYNSEFNQKVIDSFQLYINEPVTMFVDQGIIIIGDLQKEVFKISCY